MVVLKQIQWEVGFHIGRFGSGMYPVNVSVIHDVQP